MAVQLNGMVWARHACCVLVTKYPELMRPWWKLAHWQRIQSCQRHTLRKEGIRSAVARSRGAVLA